MAELGWSEGGDAVTVSGGPRPSLEDVGAELLFEKVLTSCDAASRGRIVLPKVRKHFLGLFCCRSCVALASHQLQGDHLLHEAPWMLQMLMCAVRCTLVLRLAALHLHHQRLQKAAIEHFACQDGKVGLTVHCEDTFGNEHTILHRFWTNAKCA